MILGETSREHHDTDAEKTKRNLRLGCGEMNRGIWQAENKLSVRSSDATVYEPHGSLPHLHALCSLDGCHGSECNLLFQVPGGRDHEKSLNPKP